MATGDGYRVEIARPAGKRLGALPRDVQESIAPRINDLGVEPRPHGCKKLQGSEGLYRIRAGDYRVVYKVDDDACTILVTDVAHRKDVYRP